MREARQYGDKDLGVSVIILVGDNNGLAWALEQNVESRGWI